MIKKLLACAVAVVSFGAVSAQDLKFGHIESQKFLMELPEAVAAQSQLQAEQQKIEAQFAEMQSDLQKKYMDYMSKRDSLPDLIKATKEKEIQDSNERLENFQRMAQSSLQQKEQQLLEPIITRYQAALKSVAEEGKFVYIFDMSAQVVLYHSEQSVDVAPLVKAKMQAQQK